MIVVSHAFTGKIYGVYEDREKASQGVHYLPIYLKSELRFTEVELNADYHGKETGYMEDREERMYD